MPFLIQQCLAYLESKDHIEILKQRSQEWTKDLIVALVESGGLGADEQGSEEQDVRQNGRMRANLKQLLLESKDLTMMTQSEKTVLWENPDLAVELLQFVIRQWPRTDRPSRIRPTLTLNTAPGGSFRSFSADDLDH